MRFGKTLALTMVAFLACGGNARAVGFFGIEGFHDRYREPERNGFTGVRPDVSDTTNYGGVIAGFRTTGDNWFIAADGRFDYGKDHYKSISGTSSGAPQYEAEARLRFGPNITEFGGLLMPYLGIGERFLFDHGDGILTNLGFSGYDRYVAQTYIPIGATWNLNAGGWSIDPTVEWDQLVYGRVENHTKDLIGFDFNNTQTHGWGARADLMLGRQIYGHRVEFGPFIRYWNIDQSGITRYNNTRGFIEPLNTRVQYGAQLRINFK